MQPRPFRLIRVMGPGMLWLLGVAVTSAVDLGESVHYEPTWDSLDKRPLPDWYDEGKLGIFIHWGVFSVPSFGSEWFWSNWATGNNATVDFMNKNFKPNFTYADFGPMFTAEFYDPYEWADIFKASGAKYVVLTSKHHEGYTLWPSKYSWNWNAYDVGPHRDLVGELATAIRSKTDIQFGLYHSMFEWFHPLYLQDKDNKFETRQFVLAKTMPELHEIVETYKPAVVWSDGDWEPTDSYWNSTGFLAWLYNDSPVKDIVAVNDRWGSGIPCNHGGFYTCSDRYNPGVLQPHKWENCMTLDKGSWGYRRNSKLSDYMTIEELIQTLAETISCGGNLLMNVGPTHDGRILPIFEERLRQLGQWLSVAGEAVYGSKPWLHQNDTLTKNIWYTSKPQSQGTPTVYVFVLQWPEGNVLTLGSVKSSTQTQVNMLGSETPLPWKQTVKGLQVTFPSGSPAQLPTQWSWVLKLENVGVSKKEDLQGSKNRILKAGTE